MRYLNTFLLLTTLLLLGACASQDPYRAASGSGFGYQEQQLNDTQYKVSFAARGNDSEAARSFAMRRAAELTAERGYDWFVVTDKETLTERETPSTTVAGSYSQTQVTDCGLLGCRSRTVVQPDSHAGTTMSSSRVEVVLQIRLGKGIRPEGVASYPAQR